MSAISFAPNTPPAGPAKSATAGLPLNSRINPSCYLGATALLSGEDQALFTRHLEWLMNLHKPATSREAEIVRCLQWSQWRMQRIRRTETFLLALGMRDHADRFASESDPEIRNGLLQAAAYESNARLFDQLRRHENQFVREQTNLLKLLAALQSQRESAAPAAAHDAAVDHSIDYSAETPPVLGFDPAESPATVPDAQSAGHPNPPGMPKFTGPLRDFKRKQWLRNNGY